MLTPRISPPSSRTLFAGIVFLGLLAMSARPATDPDLWWHLRTGQLIVETGHVPHTDPFSFTRFGKPWVSHEWLSEIVLYELWSRIGPGALIAFSAIVTTAGFLILYWRCPGSPHWAAALTVLGAVASAPSWGARPQMFTFAFASLLLWLLEQGEDRPRFLLFIPPLFLLWLNLHAGFALGPALMFLYALGLIFECMAGTTPWQECRATVGRILAVTLACLALVPLNPSGAQLYRYPLNTLRSSGMRAYIVEWFSPDFHHWIYTPLLLIILLALIALGYSRRRVRGRMLLPLLFTAAAALDAVRHIPIFVLLATPVIASALPSSSGRELFRKPRGNFVWMQPSLYVAAVLLAFFAIVRWVDLTRDQQAQEATQFPKKAVDFLRTSHEPDHLFVHYAWGGYAIWRLGFEYHVFADGRADLYGDDLLRQAMETIALRHPEWSRTLDRWNVQTVLIPPNSALGQALLLDPQWRAGYRDTQAIVFVRVAPDQ
jgi:hypothetical protein